MLKKENIKLASSHTYFENILSYIQDDNIESFLDFGCGIGNKLGRYLSENYDMEVYVHDEKELEALGKSRTISFDQLKRKEKKFDIIHASCLFHEVCARDDFEHREMKGGPHTIESLMLAELFRDLLTEGGTIIIEDFVACTFDEFIQNHYFISTLEKDRYKELLHRLEVSLINFPNEKSAQNDIQKYGYGKHTNLMRRIFFRHEPLRPGEFKKLDEFGKVLVYLKRYRDHHLRHEKQIYERMFSEAGLSIEKTYQDSALTCQWFLRKS
jgi:hypothetical protein